MNPITRKETFLAKAGGQSVNTPKPITREEMFLQKISENGGGTGGVTSWNDLKDRPFGESDNAVLLPNTQFAYESTFEVFAVPGYIDFLVGKTYTVNWNGVDYTTEAVPGQFNGEDLVMIGNPAALGGTNNNLPFAIACLMGSVAAIPLDGSTAVNVGIIGFGIVPIPFQYLTNALPYYIDVTATPKDNSTAFVYECSETVSNLMEVYESGREIKLRVKLELVYLTISLTTVSDYPNGKTLYFTGVDYFFGSNNSQVYIVFHPQEDDTYIVDSNLIIT